MFLKRDRPVRSGLGRRAVRPGPCRRDRLLGDVPRPRRRAPHPLLRPHRRRAATAGPGTTTTPADPDDVLGAVYVSYPADELQNSYGTAYSSAGATFVVDSSGTIVLDANRGADEAVQGSLSALINDNADSAQVSSLLAGIASDTSAASS